MTDDQHAALARSSSFVSQALHRLQQPSTNNTYRRPLHHQPSPTQIAQHNGAAVGIGNDIRRPDWNNGTGSGKSACVPGALRDFEVYPQNLGGRLVANKLQHRPSSAKESTTYPFGGKATTSGDPVQASFFPLLPGEDVEPNEYQRQNECRSNTNFDNITASSHFASDGEAGLAYRAPDLTPSDGAIKGIPTAYSLSRSFISKTDHQRDRRMGQPFRAYPKLSSKCTANDGRIGGEVEAFAEPTPNGGIRATVDGKIGGAHKQFTPLSLALSKSVSGKIIVGRARIAQAIATKSTCGNFPGGGSGAAPDHTQLHQHSPSAKNIATSSPRASSPSFYPPNVGYRVDSIAGGRQSATALNSNVVPHSQVLDGAVPANGVSSVYSNGRRTEEKVNGGIQSKQINTGTESSSLTPSKGDCSSTHGGGFSLDEGNDISPSALGCKIEEQVRVTSFGGIVEGKEGKGAAAFLPAPVSGMETREFDGGLLVVRKSELEHRRSTERLDLHRRQLKSCPLIRGGSRLRLLNYQNNLINKITNLANLPNLIFLDLYNNLIDTLEGPLSSMSGLRVVMLGKNRIEKVSNIENLRKLDVLDLHSNVIRDMEGFDGLPELRVLNLAGNRLRIVENVSCLTALTELNLRRNIIEKVMELDVLPRLQRLFLSNNRIKSFDDCRCIFSVGSLLELSLDGNPVAGLNGVGSRYRRLILQHLPSLHHLDLKPVNNHGRPVPQSTNDPGVAQGGNRDSVRSRNSSLSQTATANYGITSKSPSSDANTSISSDTLPELKNGNGNGNEYRATKDENGTSFDPPYCRDITGGGTYVSSTFIKGEGQHWLSKDTMDNGDVRHQGRLGEGRVTPHPPGGTSGNNMSSSPSRDGWHTSSSLEGKWEQVRPCALSHRGSCMIENIEEAVGSPSGSEYDRRGKNCNGGAQESLPASERASSGRCSATVSLATETGKSTAITCSQEEREDPERRALEERRAAIDAARKYWEKKKNELAAHGTQPRSRHSSSASPGTSTGSSARSNHRASLSIAIDSSIPKDQSAVNLASPSMRSPALVDDHGVSTSKREGGNGGSSSNDCEKALATRSGRQSKGHSRSVGMFAAGVGYFELEQRLREDMVSSGVACALESGITLKVYGDVWRWLSDDKVCSLREKVVEAQFLYVHVNSLVRKAAAIAETFPNLSSLRLLDNGISNFKQLERLRPLVVNLTSLDLGYNPVTTSASTVALQAWVHAQGPSLSLVNTSYDMVSYTLESRQKRENISWRQSLRSRHSNQGHPPSPLDRDAMLPKWETTSRKPLEGSSGSPRPLIETEMIGSNDHCFGERTSELDKSLGFQSLPERDTERVAKEDIVAASAAFARLAEAREQAKASSWGSIVLPAGCRSPGQQSKHTTLGNAWTTSARAAKCASNIMIQRVCEAHRRNREFDRAWDVVIRKMIQEVCTAGGEHLGRVSLLLEHPLGDGGQSKARSTSSRDTRSSSSGQATDSGTVNGIRTHPPPARWHDEC